MTQRFFSRLPERYKREILPLVKVASSHSENALQFSDYSALQTSFFHNPLTEKEKELLQPIIDRADSRFEKNIHRTYLVAAIATCIGIGGIAGYGIKSATGYDFSIHYAPMLIPIAGSAMVGFAVPFVITKEILKNRLNKISAKKDRALKILQINDDANYIRTVNAGFNDGITRAPARPSNKSTLLSRIRGKFRRASPK